MNPTGKNQHVSPRYIGRGMRVRQSADGTYWISHFYRVDVRQGPGKRKTRMFSIEKYGQLYAYVKAVQCRDRLLDERVS